MAADTPASQAPEGTPGLPGTDVAGTVTRRGLLAGAAAVGGSVVVGGALRPPVARAEMRRNTTAEGDTDGSTDGKVRKHAAGPRGESITADFGSQAEGRFGLMFPGLPPFRPSSTLMRDLAGRMADPALAADDNSGIPAGYTYLGQFITHDMTFDQTPLSLQESDPHATTNFDSANTDLEVVYASRAADPAMWDGDRLRIDAPNGFPDLPRDSGGRALIGDFRNDENLLISQLHLAFVQLHNAFVAAGHSRARATELTRWHYQWLIVFDFLPRIVGQENVDRYLRRTNSGTYTVMRRFFAPRDPAKPMMPIEFSAGAFRYGHSQVRSSYSMNASTGAPIFGNPDIDLHGFRPVPAQLRIDWSRFFQLPGGPAPVNLSRRIDSKIAVPLFDLPESIIPRVGDIFTSLAERNLLRGAMLGVAAGQDIAKFMRLKPLTNGDLGLTDPGWGGKAPLWFYALKEAELQQGGRRLGDLGGRIVAEVLLTLMHSDRSSFFHVKNFAPVVGSFDMGRMLKLAGAA